MIIFKRLFFVLAIPLGLAGLALNALAQSSIGSIVVGRSLPLSGPMKSYGEAKRDGGDAYIAQINHQGGVNGKSIQMVTLDDEYVPAKVVENLKQLASKNAPVAFLGLFGVPTVAAALPVLLELKIPAVGLTSGMAGVRTPFNAYAFPVRAGYEDEAKKLISHAKTTGVTRIAVLYTDNPFGQNVRAILVAALNKAGLQSSEVQLDVTGKNAKAVAEQVNAKDPQAIFLTMLSQAAVPMIKELKNVSRSAMLYTFSPVDTSFVQKELGGLASGLSATQVVPIPAGVRFKVAAEYQQALTALGRGSPSFYGLEAFVEAKVLVEGLRRSGASANSGGLLHSLETLHEWNAGDFLVSYNATDHQGANFVEVVVIDSNGIVRR